jgi:hypothetical protein
MINQQIKKFLQNFAQLFLKIVLKVGFLKLVKILLKISAVYAIFGGRKNTYLRTCGSFKSAKRLGLQFANPQITSPQIIKIRKLPHYRKVCKFADLRFAELICGSPTFDITTL